MVICAHCTAAIMIHGTTDRKNARLAYRRCGPSRTGSRGVMRVLDGLVPWKLHHEQLLFLPGRLHRENSLSVFVLDHLQSYLGVPHLVLRTPEIDLLALGHHHGEVDVLALPLDAVHGLHAGEAQLLDFTAVLPGRLLLMLAVVLFWMEENETLFREHATFLLPQLQQAVATFLQ